MTVTTGFAITASDLIDSTLRKLGVNIQGGTATSTQRTEALLALNIMAKRFFTLGMPFYREIKYNFTLTTSTADYTISPDSTTPKSGVWNVYQAYLLNIATNIEIPMRVIPRETYQSYVNKAETGTPTQVAISADGQTAHIYVAPDSNAASTYSVNLYGYKQEDTYTAYTFNIAFPMEWYEALLYGLCVRLAPEYGVALQQQTVLIQQANSALDDAMNWNPEANSTFFKLDTDGY